MRAFVIALLAAGAFGAYAAEVAFCARAEEKAGAALGVFPCVGGLALRIARARAQRRRPARKPEKERKSGRPFPCFGPLPAACLRMCAWSSCAPRAIWGLTMPASHPRWPRAFCRRFCALWARPRARASPLACGRDFQKRRLRGELAGIASLRVGHIIAAALMGRMGRSQEAQTWISIPLKVLWPPPWRASAIWWTSTRRRRGHRRSRRLHRHPRLPAWPSASWPAAGNTSAQNRRRKRRPSPAARARASAFQPRGLHRRQRRTGAPLGRRRPTRRWTASSKWFRQLLSQIKSALQSRAGKAPEQAPREG